MSKKLIFQVMVIFVVSLTLSQDNAFSAESQPKPLKPVPKAYWFWRVAEGVAKTRMPPWKKKLSEQEIWKVIAYQHTWSHGNVPAVHDHKEIEHSVR